MKNSENTSKNAPKLLAKVLAVCSTALLIPVALMGNSYPETNNGVPNILATRPTAIITDNICGYLVPVPLQYDPLRYDETLYYGDEGYADVEILDSALTFTIQVFGSYQIYESPLIVYELRDYLMPMTTYSMFSEGSFTVDTQDDEDYIPLTSYEYTIIDENGASSAHGELANTLDWLGDYNPFYSPSTGLEYIYVDYLRLEIYLDTTFVSQPGNCVFMYDDGLTLSTDTKVSYLTYSALYNDFLDYRGIVVASPTDLLWSPIRNFLTTEIFPGFNIGTVLSIGIGLLCFGMFLKIFVGG